MSFHSSQQGKTFRKGKNGARNTKRNIKSLKFNDSYFILNDKYVYDISTLMF